MSLGLNPMVANSAGAVKEDRPLEGVLCLALVQLTCGVAPFFRLFDPIEGEKRPFDPTDLAQRQGQTVGVRIGAEALEHRGRTRDAGPDRRRETDNIFPVTGNKLLIDGLRGQRGDGRTGPRITKEMEPPRGDVRNPRCELKVQQMAQRENVIGHATGVGVMTFDRQFGTVMQQAVKDVRSLTRAGVRFCSDECGLTLL